MNIEPYKDLGKHKHFRGFKVVAYLILQMTHIVHKESMCI